MLPHDVSNKSIAYNEAGPGQNYSSYRGYPGIVSLDSKCQRNISLSSGKPRETLSLRSLDSSSADDGAILQTRRLIGDTSRKGESWWRCCQAHARSCSKSVIDGDSKGLRTAVSEGSHDEHMRAQVQKTRDVQRKDKNKVYIVSRKKAQYGHLISDHGEAARDENRSPIIYRRPEQVRREVAPLWFHPF